MKWYPVKNSSNPSFIPLTHCREAEADSGHAPLQSQSNIVSYCKRLRQRRYSRRPESLFRMMRKLDLFPTIKKKNIYKPKPCEQMFYPDQRVQVDVKVVLRKCIANPELRLFQYTAIDEFTHLRVLAVCLEQSTNSSVDFLRKLFKWYVRRSSEWNVSKRTTVLNSPTVFPTVGGSCLYCLRPPPPHWIPDMNPFAPIRLVITAKWSVATERITNAFIPATAFTLWATLPNGSPSTIAAPTTFL